MYAHCSTVTASMSDETGKLSLTSAMCLLQDTSQLWLDSEPELKKYFEENNMAQVLAARQMDIIRMPEYGTRVKTVTRVYLCRGFSGQRNTFIYDADDESIIYVKSIGFGAFIDLSTGGLKRIPREIAEKVVIDEKLDMEYLPPKIAAPESGPVIFDSITAGRCDIDFNRHVNNVQYIRMAYELLPRDTEYGRLRVEYRLPAKLDDIIIPYVFREDGRVVVDLKNEEGASYALAEFSNGKQR